MNMEPCPRCTAPIRSDAEGRFPPWCSKCGADFKLGGDTDDVPSPAAEPTVAVHAVTEPRYEYRRVGRNTLIPPRLDSPSGVTATVWARCWKQHTCAGCGAVYRYRIEREATADSIDGPAARAKAADELARRLAREADPHPCPTCGLVQPDMVARWKLLGHGAATILAAGALLVVVGLHFAIGWQPVEDVATFAAGVAAITALCHLAVALPDPNRNRAANLRRTESAVAAGRVEIITRGVLVDGTDPPPNLTTGHLLALGCAVLAVPAFLLPIIVRTGNGWAVQRELPPHVFGPGDTVTVALPTPAGAHSVDGRWHGQASAAVLNAPAAAGSPALVATSRTDAWGETINTKGSLGTLMNQSLAPLYATVEIPDDPALGGQTLDVRVTLDITYPYFHGWLPPGFHKDVPDKPSFENRTATVHRDVTLHLTAAGGSKRYREAWGIGAALGLLASIGSGGLLTRRAVTLRARALPAEVTPLRAGEG